MMEKRSAGQPSWYDMRSDSPLPSERSAQGAVNVINITRRPQGGIVNIEVRRQEGPSGSPNVVQSRTYESRDGSPSANVFARIPPLPIHESRHPIDVRLRGGLGSLGFHRPLADLVRAMHGQSLFERFNESAPPMLDTAHSSVSSGRRVHTIPIRVETRHQRMGGSAPPSPQRVYEIPVNVMSSKSQPSTPSSQSPTPRMESPSKMFVSGNRSSGVHPSVENATSDAEKKLASLMSHLESEMNFGLVGSPVRRRLSDTSSPPAAVLSKLKLPPPYDGSRAIDTFGQPLISSALRDGSSTPPDPSFAKRDLLQSQSGLMHDTLTMKPSVSNVDSPSAVGAGSAAFHCLCSSCGEDISSTGEACQAMGHFYHNSCFSCTVCRRILRGKAFYEVLGKIYCEEDFLKSGFQSLTTKCDMCGMVIADLEVQAVGKSFHIGCFRCQVCNICLNETSFTTDLSGRILCLNDYYRLYAPKCSVCCQSIIPAEGSYESVKVIMLDKDFCINCFCCHDCGRQLSDKQSELCYPFHGLLLCRECNLRHVNEAGLTAGPSVVSSMA